MRAEARAKAPEEKGAKWITTFNDLVTLLMVFFVLLFTMSRIDVKKMKNFQEALQSGLGVLMPGSETGLAVVDESDGGLSGDFNEGKRLPLALSDADPDKQAEIMKSILALVNNNMAKLGGSPGLLATKTDEGVVISLEDTILFESGEAEISPRAHSRLDLVAEVLASFDNSVRVEGHTDNVPISTDRFPSNWELSTARAVNVLKYFVQRGGIAPQRLSAVGYGESRPLAPNDTPEHRSRNRRVEIVLVK